LMFSFPSSPLMPAYSIPPFFYISLVQTSNALFPSFPPLGFSDSFQTITPPPPWTRRCTGPTILPDRPRTPPVFRTKCSCPSLNTRVPGLKRSHRALTFPLDAPGPQLEAFRSLLPVKPPRRSAPPVKVPSCLFPGVALVAN